MTYAPLVVPSGAKLPACEAENSVSKFNMSLKFADLDAKVVDETPSLSSDAAAIERVGTIKPRHLEKALERMGGAVERQTDDSNVESEDDPIENAMGDIAGEILTPTLLRNMARKFAGKPLDNDALEELLLLYYDHASNIQHDLQDNLANASHIIRMLERFQSLAMLGWMKRMLREAGERANRAQSKTVTLAHIVEVDPWD